MRFILTLIFMLTSSSFAIADQQVFVQVRYSVKTEVGEFQDALYYPIDEWQNVTEKQIADEQVSRVANWIDSIQNPPPEKELTKEEILQAVASLEEQKFSIETQKAELLDKYDDAKATAESGDAIIIP